MKALIVLGVLYAAVAVLLVVELILHGFTETSWKCIFILVLGAVSFFIVERSASRAAHDEFDSDWKPKFDKLSREMNEMLYGNEDEGKEPITLVSDVLGTLTYRRKPQWYEGEAMWCKSKVKIILIKSMGEDPYAALSTLEAYFTECKSIDRMLRARIAEKKDKKLAKRIFASNITLTSEGTLELDYADPELEYNILGIYDGRNMRVKIRR